MVTYASKEVLENNVKPLFAGLLTERYLTFGRDKTNITHINDSFVLLGFDHSNYKGKLLIKLIRPMIVLRLAEGHGEGLPIQSLANN